MFDNGCVSCNLIVRRIGKIVGRTEIYKFKNIMFCCFFVRKTHCLEFFNNSLMIGIKAI